MKPVKNIRVIVRQWIPRTAPSVPMDIVRKFMQDNHTKLQAVLYVGWMRTYVGKKRTIQLIAATGKTSLEARKKFKTVAIQGDTRWIIV